MRYGFKHKLNIKGYPDNAAKNFSLTRLVIYTLFSLFLTIMLLVTSLDKHYEGLAFMVTAMTFILILGFTVLNIIAIIRKLNEK